MSIAEFVSEKRFRPKKVNIWQSTNKSVVVVRFLRLFAV